LTPERLPDVVGLCRSALDLPEDAAEAQEIVDRLRGTSAAGVRRTVGFVALQNQAVVGVVLGSTAFRDAAVGHVDLIAVHPAHRRHGIARAMLARVEGALAARGAGEVLLAGNAPVYAWPGIDVRYTPAVCAAMALGYEQDRTAWNMTADLTSQPITRSTEDAESRLADAGVTLRRAGPEDVEGLAAFALEHFGAGWGAEVTDSIGPDHAGCHLAERAGEILGFAAYGSSRPSWFGPMGTAAAARGLGVGGVLLRRCLRDQAATGLTRAQIGWVGPVPFYASHAGAWIERVFFLYRKQL
jgi:mycothiol synthase